MSHLDTTPNYPPQGDEFVDCAAHDLPSVLEDMPNETRFGAADPGQGHRVVLALDLVSALARRGHRHGAAAWAVHHMIRRGLLLADVAVSIDRPVIAWQPDPNSTVVRARGLFGGHADAPHRQVPVYGEPVRRPLASPGRPVPYDRLLVRSTPDLWGRGLDDVVPPAPGPEFSEADFDRALQALDLVLQDYAWRPGEQYLNVYWLRQALHDRGVTLALASQLLRRLAGEGVLRPRRRTIPPGYSHEAGCPLPIHRSHREEHRCLAATRERWYGYLAARRAGAGGGRALADAAAPAGSSAPTAVARAAPHAAAEPAKPAAQATPFIASELQERVLEVLDGKALTLDALAAKLHVDRSTVHRRCIKELRARGLIGNNRRVGGYFRPDAPPPKYAELVGKKAG